MPMKLSHLLNPECIELDLKEKKKPDLIRELIQVISHCVDFPDPDAIYEALMERERLTSTGIGSGIAIPHCLTGQVTAPHIAFGRKPDGAKFDSADNQPVSLFFLLVGPDCDPSIHLQILSKLARYLHDNTFCNELLAADSKEEVIEAFRSKEPV